MSLILWYKLDGNILDSSGNGNHLTDSTSSTTVNGKIYQLQRKTGGGWNSGLTNLQGSLSISLWFKHNGTDWLSECLFGTRVGSNGFMFYRNDADTDGYYRIYFWYVNTSGIILAYNAWPGLSGLLADTWYHIIMVRNPNGNLQFYKNGLLVYNGSIPSDFLYWHNNGLLLSFHLQGNVSGYTSGDITFDDIKVYDHLLSTKEVKELSQLKILHYKFDNFQEPTENISLTNGVINWSLSNLTGLVSRSTLIDNYKYRITSTTGGAFRMNFPDGILVDGKTYNLSYNYSIMGGGPDFGMTDWCDTTLFNTVTKLGFHSALGVRLDYTSVYKFMDFNISLNTVVDIWNVQLEQKDHYTPYTSSSRLGTILDLSGYENNLELLLSSTPQWVDDENLYGIKLGSGKLWFNGTSSITTDQLFLDSTNQLWTVSLWLWLLNNETDGQYLNNFNLGNKIIHLGSNQKLLLYINAGVNDSYTYSDGLIPELEWFHILFVMNSDTQRCQIYLNGEEYGTTLNYTSTDVPLGFNVSTIFGSGLTGYLDDIRVYLTDLSDSDILELYYDHTSLDEIGNLKLPEFLETKHESLILDYTVWEDGQTGSITPFSVNGTTTENSRLLGLDPWGKETVIWIATPDLTSGADGGWNSSTFLIDNTKLYRFSTWIWRNKNGNGVTYLGCYGYGSTNGVLNRSNGLNNTNPYFYLTSAAPVLGQWELWVGHIWPLGSGTGSNHPDSGRYTIDGRIGNISVDYVWRVESTSANHRSYLYYCTDITVRQHWVYPRVDICDGTEPSINELISGFDSNHIEYIRDKGGTSNLLLNIEKNSVYLGEASEVNISNGLILWYPLNGDLEDYTPNRNNGTVYGATIATGIDGKLLYDFDGSNDYISMSRPGSLTNGLTISAWVFPTLYSSTYRSAIFSNRSDNGLNICLSGTTEGVLGYVDVFEGGSGIRGRIKCPLNTWSHVLVTINGSDINIYVNGEFDSNHTYTVTYGNLTAYIGTATTSLYPFLGKIQDVRIYDRLLTLQEVGIMYDLTKESLVAMKVTNTTTYVKSQFKEI